MDDIGRVQEPLLAAHTAASRSLACKQRLPQPKSQRLGVRFPSLWFHENVLLHLDTEDYLHLCTTVM